MKKKLLYRLFLLAVFGCCSQILALGPPPEDGWSTSVGALVQYKPVYDGSDKYEVAPLPFVDVVYTSGPFQGIISFDKGFGLKYRDKNTGLFAFGGFNFGSGRKSDEKQTEDLLKGTPDIISSVDAVSFLGPVKSVAKVGIETRVADVSAEVNYHPVRADYSDHDDINYNGLLFDLKVMSGYPVLENLLLLGEGSLSFMNDDYAEAFHGVKYETENLDEFQAKGGLHSTSFSLMSLYFINKNISFLTLGKVTRYLGDAGESPLTKKDVAPEAMALVMYTF